MQTKWPNLELWDRFYFFVGPWRHARTINTLNTPWRIIMTSFRYFFLLFHGYCDNDHHWQCHCHWYEWRHMDRCWIWIWIWMWLLLLSDPYWSSRTFAFIFVPPIDDASKRITIRLVCKSALGCEPDFVRALRYLYFYQKQIVNLGCLQQ